MRTEKFSDMELAIRLVPAIRLRREYFGGLVYDTRNGNVLEVDKSTFELLNLIRNMTLKIQDAPGRLWPIKILFR